MAGGRVCGWEGFWEWPRVWGWFEGMRLWEGWVEEGFATRRASTTRRTITVGEGWVSGGLRCIVY